MEGWKRGKEGWKGKEGRNRSDQNFHVLSSVKKGMSDIKYHENIVTVAPIIHTT